MQSDEPQKSPSDSQAGSVTFRMALLGAAVGLALTFAGLRYENDVVLTTGLAIVAGAVGVGYVKRKAS